MEIQYCRSIGNVVTGGPLIFSKDGERLLCCLGSRVSTFHVTKNFLSTTSCGHIMDVDLMDLSPSGKVLLVGSKDGRVSLMTYPAGVLIRTEFIFPGLNQIKISEDSQYVFFGGRGFVIHKIDMERLFEKPYRLVENMTNLKYTSSDWIGSKYLATGSVEGVASLYKFNGKVITDNYVLSGSRGPIIGVFFGVKEMKTSSINEEEKKTILKKTAGELYVIDETCLFLRWKFEVSETEEEEEEEGGPEWKIVEKVELLPEEFRDSDITCTCVDINHENDLLIIGTSNGTYIMHRLGRIMANFKENIPSPKDLMKDDGSEEKEEEKEKENQQQLEKIGELKLSKFLLSDIKFGPHGDLVALSSGADDLLILWDWKAETFVLKQQGHGAGGSSGGRGRITALAYAPHGEILVSGDSEGTLKIWNCRTSQCFVTLGGPGQNEEGPKDLGGWHSGKITGMEFSRPPGSRDPALFTCSMDGTVRAFDILRYRNFQTFVAPEGSGIGGFSCMAINGSGEVVCACGVLNYKIYMWSVKTRECMEIFSGHTAPVTKLMFCSARGEGEGQGGGRSRDGLVSSSWDGSVRLWQVFSSSTQRKHKSLEMTHSAEVLTFDVFEGLLVSATSTGMLDFWNLEDVEPTGISIECRRDIFVSAPLGERKTSLKITSRKYFSCVKFTVCGGYVLAGGGGQFLNMYCVHGERVLVKRFVLSVNTSLSGTRNFRDEFYDGRYREQKRLYKQYVKHERKKKVLKGGKGGVGMGSKGVGDQVVPGSRGELLRRVGVTEGGMEFSPTNKEFCVATEEGVLVFGSYSFANSGEERVFRPIELDPSVVPAEVFGCMKRGEYGKGLKMALRLNNFGVTSKALNRVPMKNVGLVCRGLSNSKTSDVGYLALLIEFLSREMLKSQRVEFLLLWIKCLLESHGNTIMEERKKGISSIQQTQVITGASSQLMVSLRSMLRELKAKFQFVSKICDQNVYNLEYLSGFRYFGDHKSAKIDIKEREKIKKRKKISSEKSGGRDKGGVDDKNVEEKK